MRWRRNRLWWDLHRPHLWGNSCSAARVPHFATNLLPTANFGVLQVRTLRQGDHLDTKQRNGQGQLSFSSLRPAYPAYHQQPHVLVAQPFQAPHDRSSKLRNLPTPQLKNQKAGHCCKTGMMLRSIDGKSRADQWWRPSSCSLREERCSVEGVHLEDGSCFLTNVSLSNSLSFCLLSAYRVGCFWTCWRPLCNGLLSMAPHEDEGAPIHPTSWWAWNTPHDPQTQSMEWGSGLHPHCASRKVAPRMGDTKGCRGILPRATFQYQKSSGDWRKVPCRAEALGAPQSAPPSASCRAPDAHKKQRWKHNLLRSQNPSPQQTSPAHQGMQPIQDRTGLGQSQTFQTGIHTPPQGCKASEQLPPASGS